MMINLFKTNQEESHPQVFPRILSDCAASVLCGPGRYGSDATGSASVPGLGWS